MFCMEGSSISVILNFMGIKRYFDIGDQDKI